MRNRLKARYGMVSSTVVCDPGITLGQKGLYSYLCSYADQNDELFVGINKIANENNIGYSTALKYLSLLEKLNLITRRRRAGKSSVITILK